MRITAENTMCIIIDDQEKLIPTILEKEKLLENTKKLCAGLMALNIPCIVTEHYKKGLGETVPMLKEALQMPEKTKAYDKITFSAYENEEIKKIITESNKKNIIICGTEAHICVLQTTIDLQNNGYQVILVEDCIGSRTQINKDGAVKRAMQEGTLITTYEAILFELVRVAGTPQFKQILNIIK